MTSVARPGPHDVVIVGGGIAALEAVLALHALAGDRVRVTLVAPDPEFLLRPLTVLVPFGGAVPEKVPLAEVLAEHGGVFHQGSVASIDAERRVVRCADDTARGYDTLILAPGTRAVPAFAQGLTFDPFDADALAGVISSLEQGAARSVAFVVPQRVTWPLPLYELALKTAAQVWGMGIDATVSLVTPEAGPLAVFGEEASAEVAGLLSAAHITLYAGASPSVPQAGRVELGGGASLGVDQIVALSAMEGPRLPGIPADEEGFIVTDELGRVPGLPGVWAIGDATQQPIKQGGLACQQADAVAAYVAAEAGADVHPAPLVLALHGRLLVGRGERFLTLTCGAAATDEHPAVWSPSAKVHGRYLTPFLEGSGAVPRSERPLASK